MWVLLDATTKEGPGRTLERMYFEDHHMPCVQIGRRSKELRHASGQVQTEFGGSQEESQTTLGERTRSEEGSHPRIGSEGCFHR